MIAERPFGPTHARRHAADERELRLGDQRLRLPGRDACASRSPAISDASISSGTFSGSGAIGCEDQRGRAAEEDRDGQRLRSRLPRPRSGSRRPSRSASACRSIVDRARAAGTCPRFGPCVSGCARQHEGQRDERSAVLGPRGQDRKAIETHVARDDVGHRPARPRLHADGQRLEREVAGPHSFPTVGGRIVSGQLDEALDQALRALAERQPPRAAPSRRDSSRGGTPTPATLVKSSAGPPAAITRRWISAASSWG